MERLGGAGQADPIADSHKPSNTWYWNTRNIPGRDLAIKGSLNFVTPNVRTLGSIYKGVIYSTKSVHFLCLIRGADSELTPTLQTTDYRQESPKFGLNSFASFAVGCGLSRRTAPYVDMAKLRLLLPGIKRNYSGRTSGEKHQERQMEWNGWKMEARGYGLKI